MSDTTFSPSFEQDDVEILSREVAFRGFFSLEKLTLRHKLFKGGWGRPISRELFVRGEAVGVLLYDPVHDLIGMVEQFRVGSCCAGDNPWCLEVVAGIVEQNESLEDVAIREISEETGLKVTGIDSICQYLVSPGGTDEKLHLFCALTDLSKAGGVHGLEAEGEDILMRIFPATEVFASLYGGRFNNAASLICLQWLQLNHQRLRQAA